MGDASQDVPQFTTAEFAPGNPPMTCTVCRRPISGAYYQINRARTCPECTAKIQAQAPKDSQAAFSRAIAFGIAGALIGFALYVFFALATGLVVGWVSLAVGFIVGKAMHLGSRGVGGRRYQIAAVILTYLAVSMSAVPIAVHQLRNHPGAALSAAKSAPLGANAAPRREPMNLGKAIGLLALVGIASPILELQDPLYGVIGLVILFVGLRFAWQFTAPSAINVSGPHAQGSPAVPP